MAPMAVVASGRAVAAVTTCPVCVRMAMAVHVLVVAMAAAIADRRLALVQRRGLAMDGR